MNQCCVDYSIIDLFFFNIQYLNKLLNVKTFILILFINKQFLLESRCFTIFVTSKGCLRKPIEKCIKASK